MENNILKFNDDILKVGKAIRITTALDVYDCLVVGVHSDYLKVMKVATGKQDVFNLYLIGVLNGLMEIEIL